MARRGRSHAVHVVHTKKTGLGISYVIGPNGKKVSLHDKTITRRIHGRTGDKLLASVKKDVWHNKYELRSN